MDAMFLVLTFFIYYAASTTATAWLPIELPQAQSGVSSGRQDQLLRIVIAVDGGITLDGQPLQFEELSERLHLWGKEHPDTQVLIAADQAVAYGIPLAVLDTVRSAGMTQVGLETAHFRQE